MKRLNGIRYSIFAIWMIVATTAQLLAIRVYWSIVARWPFTRRIDDPNAIILFGDGAHDDAMALQAWARGQVVIWPNRRRVGRLLQGCVFYVGAPWWITGAEEDHPRLIADSCSFTGPYSKRFV